LLRDRVTGKKPAAGCKDAFDDCVIPVHQFLFGHHTPLLVDFDRRFRTDLKAVAAASTFAVISNLSRVVTIGIDSIRRKNQYIHRADIVTAYTTALTNFLQNFDLRH
jgi:hypothetical protein